MPMTKRHLASFRNQGLASLAWGRLEAEGYRAYLEDVYTVGVQWFWSDAIGGVKLMVVEGEFSGATQVLESPGPYEIEDEELTLLLNERSACPRCSSEDISPYRPVALLAALVASWLLLQVLLSVVAVNLLQTVVFGLMLLGCMLLVNWTADWRCLNCRNKW